VIFILCALCLATVSAAIYWTPVPWKDDGDCREIIWHTIRAPTNLERFTLWRSRAYLSEDVK